MFLYVTVMNIAPGTCSEWRKIGMEIRFRHLQTTKRHVFVWGVLCEHDLPINWELSLSSNSIDRLSGGYTIYV